MSELIMAIAFRIKNLFVRRLLKNIVNVDLPVRLLAIILLMRELLVQMYVSMAASVRKDMSKIQMEIVSNPKIVLKSVIKF
jgi:hypothetical protein